MAKTTFDPKAKAFVAGEDTPPAPETPKDEEKGFTQKSTFEKVGASKWKALASPENPLETDISSPMDDIGEGVSAVSAVLGNAVSHGIFGDMDTVYVPKSKWDMDTDDTRTPKKNESYNYFQPVDLPPSFKEVSAIYPDDFDQKSLKRSIEDSRSYYEDNLQMLKDRKTNIENVLKGGAYFTSFDSAIARQFIKKLEKAIIYTEAQMEDLKGYEKAKIVKEGE